MNKFRGILQIGLFGLKRKLFGTKYIAAFDVTDACNLRCEHCYHFYGKSDFLKETIPIEQWKERLNDLYRSGIRLVLLVGGEPALRPDVLMLADKIFPFVSVITNGTIKIPLEFKHPLFVSVDGVEKTNDKIRGQGVFSKMVENFSGDHRVIINMTVNGQNYTELEQVVRTSQEHNFAGVICNIYMSKTEDDERTDPMVPTKSLRREILQELRRVKSHYPNDFLLSDAMIRWYEKTDHRGWCYWGDEVRHFDASWNTRRCFMNKACSNCGCFAGALHGSLTVQLRSKETMQLIKEIWKIYNPGK